jgi:hypothetical protein
MSFDYKLALEDVYRTPNVITNKDKIRNEAIRLINEYYGKPSNMLGNKFLHDMDIFITFCKKTTSNIKYAQNMNGVIPISSMNGIKLNELVDTFNEFINSNPHHNITKVNGKWITKGEIEHIDFTGVLTL